MSKERARRRAERESLAQRRQLEQQQARARAQAKLRRRARWSRVFGRHKVLDHRVRERRAVVSSAFLVIVVLTWVATRSALLTLGVFIVAAVATPAVVTLLSDKRR